MNDWIDAVERHEAGTLDDAAVEIAAWPDTDLLPVVHDLGQFSRFLVRARARFQRSGQLSTFRYGRRTYAMDEVQRLLRLTDDEARRGDVSRLATRAVLLHTDIAILVDAHSDEAFASRPAGSPVSALLLLDGQQIGVARRGPHWELSRSLLDLLPPDPPHGEFKREWYVATAAHMQSRALLSDLLPHTRRARQLFPADPDILFYAGSMNETMAAPHVQAAIRAAPTPPGVTLDAGDARAHLLEARTVFGRALDVRPDFAEARVRLGRVLTLLGRHDEAERELQRAYADAKTPVVRYYAALFLGRAQAQLGQAGAARVSYGHAAALYPGAQSPPLGLSSLVRAAGDRSGALGLLLNVLRVRPDHASRQDPWWEYFVASDTEAERLIRAWRASVGGREHP